ncbi:MAG TPA: terminase small subunit [Candidatus Limnocylindrales bacterium]|nr:terminase small subunit [Candidatus Limnocylindrales bacterium]
MRIEGRSFVESVSAKPLPTPKKGEKRWTPKQARFTEALLTSNSVAEAAVKAGYPAKNARQSGHQALKAIRGRVPDLMGRLGLSEEHLIDKHLRRHLEKKKTVFIREEKIEKVKEGNRTREIVRHVVKKYVLDDNQIQFHAMVQGFLLHGSYAPRNPKEAAQYGVKVIFNDLGLMRGANGRPAMDIKPGMGVPQLPKQANERREAGGSRAGERPADKSGHK